tara:strand:+ start:4855 stop:5232 length:378 start_codon:yes stop_codon:yes gene_type:complete
MSVLKAFNEHLLELLRDISNTFPEDRDIKKAKSALEMLKKANPRALILIWKSHITDVYGEQIDAGDISFFINKDYTSDLNGADNNSQIIDSINRLRGPVKSMGEDNQKKTMKYIQNLTKLSRMYQ